MRTWTHTLDQVAERAGKVMGWCVTQRLVIDLLLVAPTYQRRSLGPASRGAPTTRRTTR